MSCRNHPQVTEALEHCYRCGYRFCQECVVTFQGHPTCAGCKDEAVGMLEAGVPAGAAAAEGTLPPGSRPQQPRPPAGLVDTSKAVVLEPTRFFQGMDKRATTWDCLAVPVVVNVIVAVVNAVLQLTMFAGLSAFIAGMGEAGEAMAPMFVTNTAMIIISVILAPVFAVIGVFLYAGSIHLWLAMTSNARLPFHQTMRGYCYSGVPNIAQIVPILGPLVAVVWSIVTTVIMVKAVHRTTTGHAARTGHCSGSPGKSLCIRCHRLHHFHARTCPG